MNGLFRPEFAFVLPHRTRDEVENLEQKQVDKDWKLFESGVNAWILQTYLLLKDQNQEIRLTNRFQTHAINIVHMADLASMPGSSRCFIVGVQADYPPLRWCNFCIVQNQSQVGRNSAWICHWPQPGLIPRSQERQIIQRVGYLGREINHYTRFFRRPSGYARVREEISRVCNEVGLQLDVRGPDRWNDYSDIDICIGLRSLNKATYKSKPPTKMLNAWLAGVPFIGGHDCAYTQLCGVDAYIKVNTNKGLRQALESLHSDRNHYQMMIEAGRKAAARYTRPRTKRAWMGLLGGPITQTFKKWCRTKQGRA